MIPASTFIRVKKTSATFADIKSKLGLPIKPGDSNIIASSINYPDILRAQIEHEEVVAKPAEPKKIITRSDHKLDILAKNPKVSYYAQHNTCALNIIQQLQHNGEHSFVMSSVAGNGKTFAVCAAIHTMLPWLKEQAGEFSFVPPVLWLTKKNAVRQTEHVAYELFGIEREDLLVVNYEELRSTAGIKEYLKWDIQTVEGQDTEVISWRPGRAPAMLVCDESHTVGNPKAKITRVLAAYVMTAPKPRLLLTSATTATRGFELMLACLRYEYTEDDIINVRKEIC